MRESFRRRPAARISGNPLRPSHRKRCYGHLPRQRAYARAGEAGLSSLNILRVAPGVTLWREKFARAAQEELLHDVMALTREAPFYRPQMPGSGKDFSVEESNFGPLGWVSDKSGYRYQPRHPVTGKAWPDIPPSLLALWDEIASFDPPQCCLVNLYRAGARMGLHQDKDEAALSAPVVSVSLGDEAVFRIGGPPDNKKDGRRGATRSLRLQSGDVVMFGGPARLAYHGIDRILPGTSTLVPEGGRINLTLRRVK
jgi:alkylated DNA repair protein (DNA oxidative demethylase)